MEFCRLAALVRAGPRDDPTGSAAADACLAGVSQPGDLCHFGTAPGHDWASYRLAIGGYYSVGQYVRVIALVG